MSSRLSKASVGIGGVPQNSRIVWLWTAVLSAFIHGALITVASVKKSVDPVTLGKVKMTVVEPTPAPVIPEPPKLKEKPKKQPKLTPTPNEVVMDAKPDVAPIQGLTKDSVSDKGTMSAPVGNTMMTEDTGQRVDPSKVEALKGDMSAPAILDRNSFVVPPYTEQAIDASLEGSYIVDVFVDVSGKVTSAELRKKIGYGMDERVLSAAKSARYTPRKNRFGASEAGWAEIKFTLVIP